MEKLSIVSIVAGYIATLFIHLIAITQLFKLARDYLQLWAFAGKLEISLGIFVIALEMRSDLLQAHQQNMLGPESSPDSSSFLLSAIELVAKNL
jgi:hypothetical protein